MSRLQDAFARARTEGRGALIIYLTAGFPSPEESPELLVAAAESGADAIELGLPFSDPVADGPVIQAASQQALDAGTTVCRVLDIAARVHERVDVPLAIMGCYNPILRYGPERFASDAVSAGISGVLIADMPPVESDDWCRACTAGGLDTIFLLAPTTPQERFDEILERTTGFVYLLARQGVTGERDCLPDGLPALAGRVREHTRTPIAVGFGISRPDHVRSVCTIADGAIVGSAVVRAITEQSTPAGRLQAVRSSVSALSSGCRRNGRSEPDAGG